MRLKAVICTLNEAPSVGDIVRGCAEHVDEVVVMDGGSEDGTCEVAAAKGARCVVLDQRGKGLAIRHAIATENADVLVFIDADGSHDPADIPRLVEPIARDEADLVIGSRITGGSEELHGSADHLVRSFGTQVIQTAINLRFGVKLTDVQNGYRALRTCVGRDLGLREVVFTIEQEMAMRCLLKGYRVMNVPSREMRRRHGKSRLSALKLGYRYVWNAATLVIQPRRGHEDRRDVREPGAQRPA